MNNKSKLGVGLAVGALAGAIAGIFLAPKSGKENREMAKDKFLEWKKMLMKGDLDKKVKEIFGEVTDSGREMYIHATDEIAKRLSTMKEAVEDVDKGKYLEVVGDVIASVRSDKAIPVKVIDNLKKYLIDDYKTVLTHQAKKAPAKKVAAKSKK